jgi:hypothetical protein
MASSRQQLDLQGEEQTREMSWGGEDCEMTLLGIGVDNRSGAPVMVLRERGEARRALPIWIGPIEAAEIARLVDHEPPHRPLTHRLLVDVVTAQGQRITHVTISGLSDGVFLAEVMLGNGARIAARPSDAVPVALVAGVPIHAAAAVLATAAVPLEHIAEGAFDDSHPPDPAPSTAEVDQRTEALRRWLDNATGQDFDHDDDPDPDPDPDDGNPH